MKNFIQKGETITFTNSSGSPMVSGTVYKFGNIVGVCVDTAADGEQVAIMVKGVVMLPKVDTHVITVGMPLYWDSVEGKVVNAISTDSTFLGFATEAAAFGSTEVPVLLNTNGGVVVNEALVNIEAIAAPDATDLATNNTLTNELKDKFDALLVTLKDTGVMLPD